MLKKHTNQSPRLSKLKPKCHKRSSFFLPHQAANKCPRVHTPKAQFSSSQPKASLPLLLLTLFSPTQSFAERLEITKVKFQHFEQGMISMNPSSNNSTTMQIAPGTIMFTTTAPLHSLLLEPAQICSQSITQDLDNTSQTISYNDTSLSSKNPINLSNNNSALKDSTFEKGQNFLFFTSGGIAVKKKNNIILSVLDLIVPQHIDPEKVKIMTEFMTNQSKQVLDQYYAYQYDNDQLQQSSEPHLAPTNYNDQVSTGKTSSSFQEQSHKNPLMQIPPTPERRKLALEYALYADKPFVISHGNDLAQALQSTLHVLSTTTTSTSANDPHIENPELTPRSNYTMQIVNCNDIFNKS